MLPEQYDCFLSYRRKDAAAAEAIRQRLVAADFKVWWDLVYLKDKYNWHEEIERHCEASRVVIPLLTPEWRHSEWTRYETYGAERVIPLLLRGKWKDVLTAPLAPLQGELLDLKTATPADWERLFQRIRDYRDEKRPVRGSQDRPTLMKYRPVDHFVGRDQTMVDLHEKLFSGKLTALTQQSIIAIPALGGVGKTTLARHYAEKFWRCYRQMFWVDCRTGVEAGFAEIYDLLLHLERIPRPLPAGAPQSDRARWVKHELSQPATQQTLLILDNAEDEASILAWLPESGDCHVLITSRFTDWSAGIQQHPVWVLDPAPARDLLLKSSGRSGPAEEAAADKAAEKLGYLPLALEQAAAYVKQKPGIGFAKYLELYSAEEKHFLDRKVPGATDYPESVYLTWRVTVQKLPEGARAILRLHAFFAPTPFPISLYVAGAEKIAEEMRAGGVDVPETPNERIVRDWTSELVSYSMANAEDEDCISIHALVQSVERHALDVRAQEVPATVAQMYVKANPPPSWDLTSRGLWAKLVSHSRALAECSLLDDVLRGRLYGELASVFRFAGNYAEGVDSARRALEACERVLGAEHPDTLTSVNNLALLLYDQGKYDEAEPLFRRALEARERVLGPEHPDTLTSVNNLAQLLKSQGNYDEAKPLFRRALEARERVLGAEHPNTLISVNNLALLLRSQGKYDEAKPLYRRALEACERVLGAEHPDTLISVNNLAYLLQSQGKYDEAEPLYRRALEASERVLGAEHPNTLTSVNNLADLLQSQGKYDEAEPLFRRALEARERALGAEHPDTLTSVNNLAGLLQSQGKYDEAEPLYRRALQGARKVLGPLHPATKTFAANHQRCLNALNTPWWLKLLRRIFR
jgi:tetratricopeptide (TPR) repeat protein